MKRVLNYNLETYRINTENGFEWIARYPTIPSAIGGGKTIAEAISELNVNANILLDMYEEEGIIIPAEDPIKGDKEYNGKVALRLSRYLHEEAMRVAEHEGMSLNAFLNECIAFHVSKKKTLKDFATFIDKL